MNVPILEPISVGARIGRRNGKDARPAQVVDLGSRDLRSVRRCDAQARERDTPRVSAKSNDIGCQGT